MQDDTRSTISYGNICESFRSIFLFSSVVYVQYTPSSKRNLFSINFANLSQLITKSRLKKETTLKKDGLFKVMIKFTIR